MNGKYYGRLGVRYHKKEAARLEHIKNKRKRSKTMVKGYKVFNPDWTCKGKQYTCPGTFEEDVNPSVCNVGMHFCKNAADCFRYYDFDPNNHVAEVIAHGTVAEGEDKCATNKLEIVREIPWAEVLEIVNTGKACTGRCNSGNWNSGDCNSGDWNKASFSNGCFNTVSPKIYMFNKPTDWTLEHWLNCRARYLLNQIDDCPLEYVWFDSMTDEEKAVHPEAKTTGGLKEIVCKVDFTAWNERRERAKRMNELQCMMNNRVRDLQETALLEMLASKDPELKAMLDEYKTLRGC